ncbi:MAG TPA: TetR family transcriptional regulator C-terminal domain-containing protein [Steroidobacteraceae bacterium]|jgi:TetR/AcrR family transcriptional repressor of bet genes|nr:TetR family transcriptional regulator C-terminal domain-containing protein [Steroidobacteraceae bacterium]
MRPRVRGAAAASERPPSGEEAEQGRRPRFERQLPAQRRAALVAATIECLKRYGHDGLSIRTISAQAGVSVGLINHHFPNKDELVAAAYRQFNRELVDGLRAAVERAGSRPARRLRAFLNASFSPPNLDADVLAVWVVFWGLYRHSRPIQRVQRETYADYVTLVRGMLADLVTGTFGRTRSGTRSRAPARTQRRVDLRRAAIGLTALIDGLWLEWCLEPGVFRPREAVALCERWVGSLRA